MIEPARIGVFLFVIVLLLLVPHIIFVFFGSDLNLSSASSLSKFFNFDEEKNLPSFYSSLLLFTSSLILFFIFLLKRNNKKEFTKWAVLALLFLFLSVDEFFMIHERTTQFLRAKYDFEGIFYFAWIIPYAIGVVFLIVYYYKFLLNLPQKTKWMMISSGFVFILGAVGFEMLGARIYSANGGLKTFDFKVLSTIEEMLEFTGVILFIYSLLRYMKKELLIDNITIHFNSIGFISKDSSTKFDLLQLSNERLKKGLKFSLAVFSFSILVVALFSIAGKIYQIPFSDFSRDPLQLFNEPFYKGSFSQLGILFWSGSVVTLYFSAFLIRKLFNDKSHFYYLIFFGTLSSLLMLDDLFLLHEEFYRHNLGIPEKFTQLFYILFSVAIFVYYRKTLLKTNLPILIAGFLFLALSIIADKYSGSLGSLQHVLEDGFKFTGILFWFGYSLETGYYFIKDHLKNLPDIED